MNGTNQILRQQIEQSLLAIRKITDSEPRIGIILGTGLGGLATEIEQEATIPYSEIPHFPLSTLEFHQGNLIFGRLGGKKIVAMHGRFHFYEGYSMQQVTYPVRVLKALGVKTLLVSNACGSVNPQIPSRSLMVIEDHINLLGGNPLIGPNDNELGLRFVDMCEPYSKRLILMLEKIAAQNNIKLFKGVYAAMTGPSLETRAEYRMLQRIGADVVGMSTVPEVIVARHSSMEVLGLSVVTDECIPETLKSVAIEDILCNAASVEPKLTLLMKKLVEVLEQ
ncbi:MAG: Purine nucleoside phosphorylase [Ignavibacteria bacterium]|nr:Purine nucleoside phosphorylase [Ignavibacteria bacterium]